MIAWLVAALSIVAPSGDISAADRIEAVAVKIRATSKPYASDLARAIVREAKVHELSPYIMAAVAWTESDYKRNAQSSRGEQGIWQIHPRHPMLGQLWQEAHASGRAAGWPRKRWRRMRWHERVKVLRDIDLGAFFAARIMRVFVRTCYHRRHRHRYTTTRYAHYQSGFVKPRTGYAYRLRTRTRYIKAYRVTHES